MAHFLVFSMQYSEWFTALRMKINFLILFNLSEYRILHTEYPNHRFLPNRRIPCIS